MESWFGGTFGREEWMVRCIDARWEGIEWYCLMICIELMKIIEEFNDVL